MARRTDMIGFENLETLASAQGIDYAELEARIDARVERTKNTARWVLFGVSIVLLAVFAAISIGIAGSPEAAESGAFEVAILMPFIGWGLTLFYFGMVNTFGLKSVERQMRMQALQREASALMLEQMTAHLASGFERDKPKRSQQMTLNSEGELIPDRESAADEEAQQMRR